MVSHTIRTNHLAFLHYEALLTTETVTYDELLTIMTPHNLGPGPVLNKELVEYLTILKHNLGLHEQITSVFVVYNNNFIRTSHAENIVFVQLLKISKNLFPTADAVAMVGGLFGMFFIYALMIPSHTSVIDAGFV
jgi:hypothetical protein